MRCLTYVKNRICDYTDFDACNAEGPQHELFKKRNGNPHKYFRERLISDPCGPLRKSIDGYIFMLSMVDDCINKLEAYI